METMGVGLGEVKQSFFGFPGQHGHLLTGVNCNVSDVTNVILWEKKIYMYRYLYQSIYISISFYINLQK